MTRDVYDLLDGPSPCLLYLGQDDQQSTSSPRDFSKTQPVYQGCTQYVSFQRFFFVLFWVCPRWYNSPSPKFSR